jgi:soluble lytic murein transglycosylase-like protein
MIAGNHLTVRDYFDKVLIGRTLNGKPYSSQHVAESRNRSFHQILKSQSSHSNQTNANPMGLTVVDYLNNPVRLNCHNSHRSALQNSDRNAAKPDEAAAASTGINTKNPADVPKALSRISRKSEQMIHPSAPIGSPTSTASNERRAIEKSIHKAARTYDLPASLLKGVIKAESNFEVNAVSQAGAQGLMQLMPGTAKDLGVKNSFDIEQNIDGGARYLRKMLESFGGDLKVALAAYNAGPGAVRKYAGQIPPYPETERYINRVLRFSQQMV